MQKYIVSVSPKGQITIPVAERKKCKDKKYLLEVKGKIIVLRPIEIKIIGADEKIDETQDFAHLAESSFDFWNNEDDDVYQNYYLKDKHENNAG